MGCFCSYSIVKTRVKNGVPCFEIEWQKPGWSRFYVHYGTKLFIEKEESML